jgi:hypothetical protein
MIVLYVLAILLVSWGCLKIAFGRSDIREPSLSHWAAVIFAYNVGAIAICFNYPLFGGTSGVEFWLLNMAVLCAAYTERRAASSTLA